MDPRPALTEPITLDQLLVFVAVAEAGSFSGAARRLRRAQSAVSYAVSQLERQLGLVLFDRGRRLPALTPAGQDLLAEAQAVHRAVDHLRARAGGLAAGVEPELRLAVDGLFPTAALADALCAFQAAFPGVALRIAVEALGGVVEQVADGRADLGVSGPLRQWPPDLGRAVLGTVPMVAVVAPGHPLAGAPAPRPEDLAAAVQIVVTDRSPRTRGEDHAVLSPRTWRVSDFPTKRALIAQGFGWGTLPLPAVAADLGAGALRELHPVEWGPWRRRLPLALAWRRADPPGPAARGMEAALRAAAAAHLDGGPVDAPEDGD